MFTDCEQLLLVLHRIDVDKDVKIELQINHITHWAYFKLGGHSWDSLTEILNELTVALRKNHHIIVKSVSTFTLGPHHNISASIFFEHDQEAARQLVSTVTSQVPTYVPQYRSGN